MGTDLYHFMSKALIFLRKNQRFTTKVIDDLCPTVEQTFKLLTNVDVMNKTYSDQKCFEKDRQKAVVFACAGFSSSQWGARANAICFLYLWAPSHIFL